jgi:hypothetical protein
MKCSIYIAVLVAVLSLALPAQSQTYFRCQSNTGVNSTVLISSAAEPKVDGELLQPGDEIAVFTPNGLCVGLGIWSGSNLAITVWGDNELTPVIDGILPGQEMQYRVYSHLKATEYDHIRVTYSGVFPATRTDGIYFQDNIYVIQSLESYIPLPGQVTLKSPPNSIIDRPVEITFEWFRVRFGQSYRVQVSSNQSFSTTIVDTVVGDDTVYTVSDLEHFTQYFWRVRAISVAGPGSWSEVWSFTTIIDFPDVPLLFTPEPDAVNQPTNVQLFWHPAPHAQTYDVQVSRQANFSPTIINASGVTDTVLGLTNLDHKSDYFWRVRSVNYRDMSEWSEGRRFTTIVNFPPAPVPNSPEDNATNIPVDTPLRWNAALDAETYHVQVSRSAAFSTLVVDSTGIDTTFIVPPDLLNNTQYFWRVRGVNIRGAGNWSTIRNYTTSPKSLILLAPERGVIWRAGTQERIEWSFVGVTNVKIELSKDNGTTWQTIASSVSASAGFFMWDVTNESSFTCKIRISDVFDAGLVNTSETFAIYPESFPLDLSLTFGNTGSTTSYRMIGIPGAQTRPMEDVLIGEPLIDWTAFHDNGQAQNYLTEYDGSSVFTFGPGKGFWMLSKNSISLRYTVGSVQLDEDNTYSIQLQNGWNIISNPYSVPVSWNTVRLANGIMETIWSFNNQYATSATFEPYKGYYFYNGTGLSSLKIPYPNGSSLPKISDEHSEDIPVLSISLRQDDVRTHPVYIRIPVEKSYKGDRLYRYAPPGDFQEISVALYDEDLPTEYKLLSEDSREPSSEGYVFTLHVRSKQNKPSDLIIDGLDNFEGFETLLIDKHTGKTYTIRDGTVEGIIAGNTSRELHLLVGSESYIRDLSLSHLPAVFTLAQNYPNPFNPETTIEYSIPEGPSNSAVTLEIYNLLGQKVRTLVNTTQTAGFYTVRWDGRNDGGQIAPSGVYLYILRAGSFKEVRRMTLIK